MKNKTHKHSHHTHDHSSVKNIKIAFFLNLSFTIVEIIGGIYTNSIAIVADAIHDLGDSLSLGLAWYLEKFSKKKRSSKFSYGYKRFSLLGALITSIVLIIGSIFVLLEAVPRLFSPEASNAQGMLILAIIGIIVNGIGVYKINKGNSLNERVISWHLLEDVLGWVAVFIIALINMVVEIQILDPLLSIIFTLFILYNVVKNLKQVLKIFMQSVPENIIIKDIEKDLEKIDNIKSIHDIHVWSLDGEKSIMTLHVIVSEKLTNNGLIKIKKEIRKKALNLKINHTTIEFENEQECCDLKNC